MFILSAVEEEVRVHPQDLHKSPLDAVTEVIEQRYIDRVLPDLGLVVTLFDIQSIEGGFVYPNDGAAFFRTKFRLVVFRPFPGEVLVGKLKSCNRNGLHVTLDFFDDIFVRAGAQGEGAQHLEACQGASTTAAGAQDQHQGEQRGHEAACWVAAGAAAPRRSGRAAPIGAGARARAAGLELLQRGGQALGLEVRRCVP